MKKSFKIQRAVKNILVLSLIFGFLMPAFSMPVFAQSASPPQPPIKDPFQVINETHYVDKYFEIDKEGNFKEHIYLGNQKIANIVYDSETDTTKTFYVSSDHLGSTAVITDEAGNIAELHDYYPFGALSYQDIVQDSRTNQLFTGKELDPENLLYYFGARYYNKDIGRFISIDPFGQKLPELGDQQLNAFLSDPQRLNSYAYTSNNPINNIDADGELTLKAFKHPGAAVAQLAFWHGGINSYLKPNSLDASAAFLRHSLSWYPDDVIITASNQDRYGNIIDQIKSSEGYKQVVNTGIERAIENGRNFFDIRDYGVVRFNERDLALSLHDTTFKQIQGTLGENGRWNIKAELYDKYDFDFKQNRSDHEGSWFDTVANNSAAISEDYGVITKYNINIDFSDEFSY